MVLFERTTEYTQGERIEGISPRVAQLLRARGAHTRAEMEAFLHLSAAQFHPARLFMDMDKAVACTRDAVRGGVRVCVYGDYDADGVCATSIMLRCLQKLGADAFYHIPSRHEEGYGMRMESVRALKEQGAGLVITVDNGVKSPDEIALCNELGIRVVVTDHHQCGDILPAAEAILCHTREGETYPNHALCGAGTAFKLAEALLGEKEAEEFIPLAGLATMADVVPLLGENRALVAVALAMLNGGACGVGLRALGDVVRTDTRAFTARDLAFGFVPRLNAAGRMEHASICVELLCTPDAKRAAEIADRLNELNHRRQAEENAICAAAAEMVEADDLTDKRCIVLKSAAWNPGVIGIAASRIAERYSRPTLLFSEKDDILTGSARSVPGVDLYAALRQNEGYFLRFGGHAFAAGVTMQADLFEAFAANLDAAFHRVEDALLFVPRARYEAELELPELTLQLADALSQLEPFGEGNPQPAFKIEGVLLRNLARMGAERTHLRATAVKGDCYTELVAFGSGHRFEELLDMERCDLIGVPTVNEWQGMRRLQLRVSTLRACAIANPAAYIAQRADKFADAFSQNILYNKGYALPSQEPTELLPALVRGGNGAMALCATAAGAERLLKLLAQEGLFDRVDVSFFANRASPCAYPAVVLAPVLSALELSRYRHILCFDGALEGFAQKLRELAPQAALYAGPCEPLPRIAFTRQDMADCYRAFLRAERRFGGAPELTDYLASVTGKPAYIAMLAVRVMLELGFAQQAQGIAVIQNPPARDLMESPTFAALAANLQN
ncbi:MAG: single-stranded-DNA-specific exonuclease RecJ [Christensenellaceae bacterium]|jgi:single-stranded-DNA-specific exonuclease RecJ|nr:single-stranded-DNA-specific exonuclease RecJ [Christensenellaceae bacterium]